jgi:hypothetical protein
LGIIPIRDDDTCGWASVDFDQYKVDLLDVVRRVESAKLPLVPCVSKSGGLHLFLFLDKPEPAGEVRTALGRAAAMLDIGECEIFPKQTKLDLSRDEIGNWMCAPYLGTTFGGKLRLQRGLKRTGAEMTLAEFVVAGEKARGTLARLAALVGKSAPAQPRARSRASPPGTDFADGPPCLQTLTASGVRGDGRKRILFMMALYYKRSDLSGWEDRLEEANRKFFKPPLPSEEVTGIMKSVRKKSYQYTCREEPMHGVCDPGLCRTRLHGVGDGSGFPRIVSWVKFHSDDPVWHLTIEGSNEELVITRIDDITNYRRFADQCGKQLDLYFGPVTPVVWAAILREARGRLDVRQAAEDTTRAGTFRRHLESFLTNKVAARRREDILRGQPWQDEDKQRYEFRMEDLYDFLIMMKMRDATLYDCAQWMKRLGGEPLGTTVGGKRVRLWCVPCGAVQTTPAVEALPIKPPPEVDG